jgi:hypothetical protein
VEQALTPQRQSSTYSPPSVASRDIDGLARRLSSAIEREPGVRHGFLSETDAPTEAERRVLQLRRNEIGLGLTPATEAEIGRAVAALRAVLPSQHGSDHDSAVLLARSTVAALRGMPVWVVNEACRLVLGAKAGLGHGFAPSPPELVSICERILAPFRQEQATIQAVLSAEVRAPINEEIRQRGYEVLSECARELRRAATAGKPVSRFHGMSPQEVAEIVLDEQRSTPLPQISIHLVRNLVGKDRSHA